MEFSVSSLAVVADWTASEPNAATLDRFGQVGELAVENPEESLGRVCITAREMLSFVGTGKLMGILGGSDATVYVEQDVSLVSQGA